MLSVTYSKSLSPTVSDRIANRCVKIDTGTKPVLTRFQPEFLEIDLERIGVTDLSDGNKCPALFLAMSLQ